MRNLGDCKEELTCKPLIFYNLETYPHSTNQTIVLLTRADSIHSNFRKYSSENLSDLVTKLNEGIFSLQPAQISDGSSEEWLLKAMK